MKLISSNKDGTYSIDISCPCCKKLIQCIDIDGEFYHAICDTCGPIAISKDYSAVMYDGDNKHMNLRETTKWMNYYHDKMIENHNKLVDIKRILDDDKPTFKNDNKMKEDLNEEITET